MHLRGETNSRVDEEFKVPLGVAIKLWQAGDFADAESYFDTVIRDCTKKHGPEDRAVLWMKSMRSLVYSQQGRKQEAERTLRETAEIQARVDGADDADTLSTRNSHAGALMSLNRYPEAIAEWREVVAGQARTIGADAPESLKVRSLFCRALMIAHQYSEAVTEYRSFCEAKRKVVGGT
jgi:hypothetical protein